MGAVAVAVVRAAAVADEVGAVARPAGELLVGGADARVDDVGVHARAGLVVGVGVVERQVALVDAVEAPGRGRLRRDGVHDLVRLDIGDARVARRARRPRRRELDREALERVLVDVLDVPPCARASSCAAAATVGRCERASVVARTASVLKTTM